MVPGDRNELLESGGARPGISGMTVLVASPSHEMQLLLRSTLARPEIPMVGAVTLSEALALHRRQKPCVTLIDLALDPRGVAGFLDLAGPAVIALIEPHSLPEDARLERVVGAMRAGVQDILRLPDEAARLLPAILAAAGAADGGVQPLPGTPPAPPQAFIGSSAELARVDARVQAIAASDAPVLITGESGTGKSLAAQTIHHRSRRSAAMLVTLDCAALTPEEFETELSGHFRSHSAAAGQNLPGTSRLAHGGTLLLEEICEMPQPAQARLLRLMRGAAVHGNARPRPVDLRIIATTRHDPDSALRDGRLSADLFYRLNVLSLALPPLRARGSDVVEIARSALTRIMAEEGRSFDGFDAEAEGHIAAMPWPGNIRELENMIRGIVVLHGGGMITAAMLPCAAPTPARNEASPPRSLAAIERAAIDAALARHDASVPRAARELGVSPSTLYRKLEAWNRGSPRAG